MSELRFSVVIPTYNRCLLLPQCIGALREQSLDCARYEILVVDNASRDNTREEVKRLQNRPGAALRYLYEERPGLMEARHAGARAARGEILAYTDDDALAHTNWLAALDHAYSAFQPDCAGGKILIRWDKSPAEWVLSFEECLGKLELGPKARFLETTEYIYGGNFSILRNRLYEIGGFNPDQFGDFLLGDGEIGLCEKIHSAGWKMLWVPDALIFHCQTAAVNGTSSDLSRRFRNNGVTLAYREFRLRRPSRVQLQILGARARIQSLTLGAASLVHLGNAVRYYQRRFRAAYMAAASNYYFRLAWDRHLRHFAGKDRWLIKDPGAELS